MDYNLVYLYNTERRIQYLELPYTSSEFSGFWPRTQQYPASSLPSAIHVINMDLSDYVTDLVRRSNLQWG